MLLRWPAFLRLCLAVLVLTASGAATTLRADDLEPLRLNLPAPMFVGTPKERPPGSNIEPLSDKPRPAFMVPKGLKNLAPASRITTSDARANAGTLRKLVDGNKDPSDENTVLLRKGTQWVQLDLGSANEIFVIVIWHSHDSPKVYRDVVVQVADDAEFTKNLQTVFNNDLDNSSNRGPGTDREYYETHEGKLIDAKGVKGRFVRCYSKGSTDSALNEYTEVEIYGRPAK